MAFRFQTAAAGLLLLLATAGAPASPVPLALSSPDARQTWPYGNLRDWNLRLDPDGRSLALVVTYSNELFADRETPQHEEDLFFRFPAAAYRPERGAFVVSPKGGKPVVVAWRSPKGGSVRLDARAFVRVVNRGGRLSAFLLAGPSASPEPFAETASAPAWSLQHLIEN